MTTTAPAPPARPIVPRPLWERHQLFQEPEIPEGLVLEDDADDLQEDD